MDNLRQLMLEAEQQSAEISNIESALPKLDRTFHQVYEASEELWRKLCYENTAAVRDSSEFEMSTYALPTTQDARIADISKLSKKLDDLTAKEILSPISPDTLSDIDLFIKNECQNALMSICDLVSQNFNKQRETREENDPTDGWKSIKRDFLLHFPDSSENYTFNDTMMSFETTMKPEAPTMERSMINSVEMIYAEKIINYNRCILNKSKTDSLGKVFKEVALQLNDPKIPDLWDCMNAMIHLPVQLTDNSGDPITNRYSENVLRALIQNAKSYLQDRYKLHMESVVQQNLHGARLGGMPSTFALVKGYVSLHERSMTSSEDGVIDEQPVWNLIYYCLRCGNYKAALQCAQQVGSKLSTFCTYLDELTATGVLSENSLTTIRNYYKSSHQTFNDPFKKAVYCLLGQCDIREDFPEVLTTAEDYVWYKLGQVTVAKDRSTALSTPNDILTYNHLQSLITEEYGESYYNASNQPYLYATLLFLTGQFESCIEFLSRVSMGSLKAHAVHMAVALHETGLLATPKSLKAHLLSTEEGDPSPSKRINLLFLIERYCHKFKNTNINEAINYYYLLREFTTEDGTNLFEYLISDLVLTTKAFNDIVGTVSDNGVRLSGVIDSFYPSQEDCKKFIRRIAENAEKNVSDESAVILYELCGDHDGAMRVMSEMFANVLSDRNAIDNSREKYAVMATTFKHRYKGKQLNCLSSTLQSFQIICKLITFFDFFHQEDYRAAKHIIMDLDLLPAKESAVEMYRKKCIQLHSTIKNNIPRVVVALMKILVWEFESIKFETSNSVTREQNLDSIRNHAQALTSFSATADYPLAFSSDLNSILVQLVMRMN